MVEHARQAVKPCVVLVQHHFPDVLRVFDQGDGLRQHLVLILRRVKHRLHRIRGGRPQAQDGRAVHVQAGAQRPLGGELLIDLLPGAALLLLCGGRRLGIGIGTDGGVALAHVDHAGCAVHLQLIVLRLLPRLAVHKQKAHFLRVLYQFNIHIGAQRAKVLRHGGGAHRPAARFLRRRHHVAPEPHAHVRIVRALPVKAHAHMAFRNLPQILIGDLQLVVDPHLAHPGVGQRNHQILRRQLGTHRVNHQGAHFFGVRGERDVQIGALLIRVREHRPPIGPGSRFL